MSRTNLGFVGIGLAVVLFFALNIASSATLRGCRADFTEDKLFTLDEGSKAVARGIDEPIQLNFYYSREVASDVPQVVAYADTVLGMLEEFEREGHGKLRLSVIDPEPFSDEEEQAVAQGVQGMQVTPGGDPLYFGLVGTSSINTREVIPFFALEEAKQRTLEYDLAKLIWTLAHPDKRKVGILSALSLEGGGGMPMMGQSSEPRWKFLDQLEDYFEVEVVPQSADSLPDDLDALMVVQPRSFQPKTVYLIDQWALAGKPLLVFVDPQCEVDPGESDPSNPMSRYMAERGSNLDTLFNAWGIEMVKGKVVGDRVHGLRMPVPVKGTNRQVEVPVVYWMQIDETGVSHDDPITRLLENLLIATPGSLRKLSDGTTTFTPLVQTSEEASEIDASKFQFQADPQELLASFVPAYEKLTLAARVTGDVKTAFPDGKPKAEDGEPDDAPAEDPKSDTPGLTASVKPLNAVVFADADMLHDRLWLRELRIGNQSLGGMLTSQNIDLVRNAIESLTGGQELMQIHTRGRTSRPFERVQAIQRDADQRYLAEQQEFERKLQDANQRLSELQTARGENSEELVTAEQRKEEDQLRLEIVSTKRALRNVNHDMRKDIERLGTGIDLLNIGLMPALVCGAAILLGVWKARRRTSP